MPRLYPASSGFVSTSRWRTYYAVVSSSSSGDFSANNCGSVYDQFELDICDKPAADGFGPDPDAHCRTCLRPKGNAEIPFCDKNPNGPPCLVTIRNVTTSPAIGDWTEDCYIEVFFIGILQDIILGSTTYSGNTIISSLRWSATADFMKSNGGYMLNCTNHSPDP